MIVNESSMRSTMKGSASMSEGNCRHFNGIMNKNCEEGVSYKELTNNHELGLPCISSGRDGDRVVAICDGFSTLTKEEREAEEKASSERVKYTMTAMALCVKDSDSKGFKKGHDQDDVAGEVDCPKCGKKLVYERASYNGHIRAACSTEGCLRWIN